MYLLVLRRDLSNWGGGTRLTVYVVEPGPPPVVVPPRSDLGLPDLVRRGGGVYTRFCPCPVGTSVSRGGRVRTYVYLPNGRSVEKEGAGGPKRLYQIHSRGGLDRDRRQESKITGRRDVCQ